MKLGSEGCFGLPRWHLAVLPLEQVRDAGLLAALQSWHMANLGMVCNLVHTLAPAGVLQRSEQGRGTRCSVMGIHADLLWLRGTCSSSKSASLVGGGPFWQVGHLKH